MKHTIKKGPKWSPLNYKGIIQASKIFSSSLGLGISKSNPCEARILSSNSKAMSSFSDKNILAFSLP